jgi:prevent-host-death family protein
MSSTVASRELRNDTAGVLRRVQDGERVVITVNGAPVAELRAISEERHRWLARADFTGRLHRSQADPGLAGDLARLTSDTTDDLDPLR